MKAHEFTPQFRAVKQLAFVSAFARPTRFCHSLVANALDAGLTLAEASRLARHATPAVTATVYADVLEAKRDRLGQKLAQAGFGA